MNDLKLLLVLNGGKRLPELEEEIFANKELLFCYLSSLTGTKVLSEFDAARQAYWYANDVIKGRWPEAEHIIATTPHYAAWYATDVIKGHWPQDTVGRKAEKVIRTDIYAWENYCNIFGIKE